MPKIEKLSNNLDEYERQNTDTQECVKQLDRNLSLKCNKSGLTKLEGDLIKAMIPKAELPIIEKKMKDIRQITEDQDKNLRSIIEKYRKGIDEMVHLSIERQVDERFEKYDRVAGSFEQFFN